MLLSLTTLQYYEETYDVKMKLYYCNVADSQAFTGASTYTNWPFINCEDVCEALSTLIIIPDRDVYVLTHDVRSRKFGS